METKEIKINVPEGYEIDKENSTFECIKLKPIQSRFSDYDGTKKIFGFCITIGSSISEVEKIGEFRNYKSVKRVFATEKQAKSALAMAQISQIMTNDDRFGGAITDEEWEDSNTPKYCISREKTFLQFSMYQSSYEFLAFHTTEQRDLFYQENRQLVKDYLMID